MTTALVAASRIPSKGGKQPGLDSLSIPLFLPLSYLPCFSDFPYFPDSLTSKNILEKYKKTKKNKNQNIKLGRPTRSSCSFH